MKSIFPYIFFVLFSTQSFAKNTESVNCEDFFSENAQNNISRNQRWEIIQRNQKYINLQLQDIGILEDIKSAINPELISGYDFRIRIIKNPQITVAAIPDGEIVIDQSFWQSLTDSEKYFTIAHEIGHIVMQHSCKYYIHVHTKYIKDQNKTTMNIDNYLFSHATIHHRLTEFEESQEIAADNFAFDIIKRINLKIQHLDMLLRHEDTPESRKNNILSQLKSINKI